MRKAQGCQGRHRRLGALGPGAERRKEGCRDSGGGDGDWVSGVEVQNDDPKRAGNRVGTRKNGTEIWITGRRETQIRSLS